MVEVKRRYGSPDTKCHAYAAVTDTSAPHNHYVRLFRSQGKYGVPGYTLTDQHQSLYTTSPAFTPLVPVGLLPYIAFILLFLTFTLAFYVSTCAFNIVLLLSLNWLQSTKGNCPRDRRLVLRQPCRWFWRRRALLRRRSKRIAQLLTRHPCLHATHCNTKVCQTPLRAQTRHIPCKRS